MYGTVTDANSYFVTKSFDDGGAWANEPPDRKLVALNRAAILINRLAFEGDKTDPDQENEFPRDDEDMPLEIEYAAYEIARELLRGRDPEQEYQLQGASRLGFNRVTTEKKPDFISEAKLHGIPSIIAWDLIKPFLTEGDTFTIERI